MFVIGEEDGSRRRGAQLFLAGKEKKEGALGFFLFTGGGPELD